MLLFFDIVNGSVQNVGIIWVVMNLTEQNRPYLKDFFIAMLAQRVFYQWGQSGFLLGHLVPHTCPRCTSFCPLPHCAMVDSF